MVADQVSGLVKFTDSRDFKIHSGQITDLDSELSHNNQSKQIDDGASQKVHRD